VRLTEFGPPSVLRVGQAPEPARHAEAHATIEARATVGKTLLLC
jgi:hypothetical protein